MDKRIDEIRARHAAAIEFRSTSCPQTIYLDDIIYLLGEIDRQEEIIDALKNTRLTTRVFVTEIILIRSETEAHAYAARWMAATWGAPWGGRAPKFHFNCPWLKPIFWRPNLCITLGKEVFCRQDYITDRLVRHECTHVKQQYEMGLGMYPAWLFGGDLEAEAKAYENVNPEVR